MTPDLAQATGQGVARGTAQGTMCAAVLTGTGAPLDLQHLDRPEPAPGQVLVRITASGVNPLDVKIQAGRAAHARVRPPAVLGLDLAGVVAAVGPHVTGFAPGDRVYGLTGGVGGLQGSLAEYAAVDARLLAHAPTTLTLRQAAALPLAAITAWEALVDRADVHPGQTVLVHGGAGGVGSVAVQLARLRGAQVYATGSPASLAVIQELGAEPIDRTTTDPDGYVEKYTAGRGFDVVLDTVGGATLDASFAAVRVHGHVVSVLGWGQHSLAPLSFRGATYSGVFALLPLLTGEGRERHGEILREVAAAVDAGTLRPRLHPRTFTLATVDDAYRTVGDGTSRGKVVVDVDVDA